MDKLKYFLLKHPNRIKYGFILVDMFLILMAIKIFINYTNIEQAIEQTAKESHDKANELWFTQNFQIAYEKSEYAQRFLKHENNMLLPGEIIIKFQDKSTMPNTGTAWTGSKKGIRMITTPEEARQQFLKEKLFPPKESNTTN